MVQDLDHDLDAGVVVKRPAAAKEYENALKARPRGEPEIAFLLKAPLCGAVTPLQALSAVEAVAPAMEIIDSLDSTGSGLVRFVAGSLYVSNGDSIQRARMATV